jgi:nucleoid-associated protein YgaU
MAAAVAFPVPTTRTVPSGASEGFPLAGRSGRSAGERHRPPVPAPSRVASRGIVLVAGQAAAALGGSPLAPVERRPQVHAEQVVVEPGDTLWSIAKRVAPDRDPREVVDALVQARGTAALLPGETVTWLDS